jgi:type I restriction enzyme S subunit
VSKWEKVRWSDVIKIQNGKNHKHVENPNGKYPIYGSGGIMGYAEDYLCEAETVVLGRKGNINTPIFVSEKFWNVDTAFGLVADKKRLFPKYLFYFCQRFDFERLNTTVTIPSLTKSRLLDIEMSLPPTDIQKQIANQLDAVTDLLALQKRQLEELDQLIKSVFYEMFGDPVLNDKGWTIGVIADLAKSINYGTSQKATTEPIGIPILRMNNITYEGSMDFSDIKYIELNDEDKKKYLVHKGELLFNRTNSKELVGKTAVYKRDEPMAFAGYLLRLVPNEKANSEYISGFLNSNHGKKILYGMAKNIVGMANINAKEFGSIPIPIPPIGLQNKYADMVNQIESQKSLVKQSIDETQRLFDSLMSKYFDD